MPKIELSDDGTMDTVLCCSECGEEFRGNYDSSPDMPDEEDSHTPACASRAPFGECTCGKAENSYDAFIASFIEEVEDEHVCEMNPREKGEDDGTEYGHPQDYLDGLE